MQKGEGVQIACKNAYVINGRPLVRGNDEVLIMKRKATSSIKGRKSDVNHV